MGTIIKNRYILSIIIIIICFCLSPVYGVDESVNITEVGTLEDPPVVFFDIAVSGNYAYAVGRDGLTVIDISTPAFPKEAGSYPRGFVIR